MEKHADVAQLVEHHLAKVGVAGSNPVVRSSSQGLPPPLSSSQVLFGGTCFVDDGWSPAAISRSPMAWGPR